MTFEPIETEASGSDEKNVEAAELPISEEPSGNDINGYVSGKGLYLLTTSLMLCSFTLTIEIVIISTALNSITNDLHGFNRTGWVVTAFLITYSSTLIIWTKASDLFGRKPSILMAVLFFTIFSGACGASQTITQLIIFRAFQGIGAAGGNVLAYAIFYEMIPKHILPSFTSLFAVSTTVANICGPLIGGGFSERVTWRWIFLFNVPVGLFIFLLMLAFVPSNFPYQNDSQYVPQTMKQKFAMKSISKIDLTGAFLLLGASLLLVTVLLGADTQFSWHSTTAISLLTISGVFWILFVLNEYAITNDKKIIEPMFPWRFVANRKWMGVLLLSLLTGIPWYTITIEIPQRFQAVDKISPIGSGLRLIPFNSLLAIGAIISSILAGKAKIPPIYLMLVGSIIQVTGTALLSIIPNNTAIGPAVYGYEALAGLGVGMVVGMVIAIPPQLVESRDLAISSGALIQFRALGGAIGLAITSAAMNNFLTSHLKDFIDPAQLTELFQSISSITNLPPATQARILTTFAEGYSLQMKIMAGFAGAQVLVVGMLWENPQVSI